MSLCVPVLQYVVDIATLTGAAGVALGQDTAALFANTDSLAAAVDDAGRKTGGTAGSVQSSPAPMPCLDAALVCV